MSDNINVRLTEFGKKLKEGSRNTRNDLLTMHIRNKPKDFIDSLVLKGFYMSRSEFIRMAIDQKIEKVISQLNDPFYQELVE